MNIYAYAEEAFNIFVDNLDVFYGGDKEKIIKEVLAFLTSETDKWDKEFNNIIECQFKDLKSVKKVIILIIASKAYMVNYYNYLHDINKEQCSKMLEELESKSLQSIIKEFWQKSEFSEELIDDYFSYLDRPYIFKNRSKSLIVKNNKTGILLKINPFEVLDLHDYIADDMYMSSEICIQTFLDCYEQSLLYSINDECGEEQNYSCKEEFLVATFISNLKIIFHGENALDIFIKYVLSNIYETLITELNGKNQDFKKYVDIIYCVENMKIDEIINRFLSDYKFTLHLIDAFLDGNDYLIEGDLLCKREAFKKIGNVKLLRKLNPFYHEEEIIYQKIKEISES